MLWPMLIAISPENAETALWVAGGTFAVSVLGAVAAAYAVIRKGQVDARIALGRAQHEMDEETRKNSVDEYRALVRVLEARIAKMERREEAQEEACHELRESQHRLLIRVDRMRNRMTRHEELLRGAGIVFDPWSDEEEGRGE